ncbi:MAG: 3'(2'),5'-bisphosphate nucleotidase [Bacteroidetes bacterium]|nr:MAG: 3'(2'),5'-bisphosphate nucleotidase [Bacteroidota bacterium]
MIQNIDIQQLIRIAKAAGEVILKIYELPDFQVQTKEDDSPVTIADKLANDLIVAEILKLYPQIPIISEEGADISYQERKNWEYFWLIDPLDGTKEFIKKNGEFTVNIALVHKNKPVLGVIYVPVQKLTYFAKTDLGAFKQFDNQEITKISVSNKNISEPLIAISSRSHRSEKDELFLQKNNIKLHSNCAGAIKYGWIAEGRVDVYFRSRPCMEWDSAAGQAIVEIAGGTMLDANGNVFSYNKESLLNGNFLCYGCQKLLILP